MNKMLIVAMTAWMSVAAAFAQTYEYNFEEIHLQPKVKKEHRAEGHLVYTAPSSIRMDYTSTPGDYMLIDEKVFDKCTDGEVQHLPIKNSKGQFAKFHRTIILAFQHNIDEIAKLQKGEVTTTDKGGKQIVTIASTKGRDQTLTLTYDTLSGQLIELVFLQANGNSDTYRKK